MSAPLPAYPDTIPAETWGIVYDALTGHITDVPHTVHCLYVAAGFALGKALPEATVVTAPQLKAAVRGTRDQAIASIRELSGGAHFAAMASPPSWLAILQAILAALGPLIGG